jgi:hypothetical protein
MVDMTKIIYGNSPAYSARRLLVGDRADGDVDVPPPIIVIPPADPNVDPYWDGVVLLVGSDSGFNVDESTRHKGDPGGFVSTNAKFGQYSVDVTRSLASGGTLLDYGGGEDFNMSPTQMNEFTMEAWFYLDHTITDVEIIVGRSFVSVQWIFGINASELRFSYQSAEGGFGGNGAFTNVLSTNGNIVGGRWYFAAVDKSADKSYRLYLGDPSVGPNAKMIGKLTPNDASIDGSSYIDSVEIGQTGLFGTNDLFGMVDELRITKGIARYRTDGSFPMPTTRWPRTATREVENEVEAEA